MRIKLNFSVNKTDVPINNQHLLNGYIHKCLGKNNKYHDTWSNYSISSLLGGKMNDDNKTVSFKNGAYFTVTSQDSELISKMLLGSLMNQELFHGMTYTGVDHIDEKFYDGINHFVTLSPFLIKEPCKKYGERSLRLDEDKDFEAKVKEYLIRKLNRYDKSLDLTNFDVKIPKRKWHYTKKIWVQESFNWGNMCQIDIISSRKIAEIIYNLGIGKSTGSGFGTIAKTESTNIYFKHK